MLADEAGNIWFGTDAGASRYDGKTFTNFTTQDGLSGNSVNSIAQDRTGRLWFATTAGVSRYDGKSFTDFRAKDGSVLANARSIIEDKAGNILIGSQNGLRRYDGQSLTRLTPNFSTYVFEDRAGNLWSSESEVNSREMILVRYDKKSFNKTVIASDLQIFGIIEDKAGTIWYGTAHGVGRYDGKSLTNLIRVPNPLSKWNK